MTKSKRCAGICPACGSENITYCTGYVQDEDYVYEASCDDCEQEFIEYYDITYSETRWDEANEDL